MKGLLNSTIFFSFLFIIATTMKIRRWSDTDFRVLKGEDQQKRAFSVKTK